MSLLELITPRLLLLEKPLACDAEQGRALKATCDAHPEMNVAVNYIRRWLPAVQTWRKRLQAGQLGNFLHGNLTYGKGLLSNGSHFVNLAESWLGPLTVGRILDRVRTSWILIPRRVWSYWLQTITSPLCRFAALGHRD